MTVEFLPFFVEGTDTIYYDEITASKIYSRLPKQKGKEWRKYYKLVHNFSKTYPYALAARKIVARADSTIQNTLPTPPIAIAEATPTMLPTPSVPARARERDL